MKSGHLVVRVAIAWALFAAQSATATAINTNLIVNGDGENPAGAGGFSVSVAPLNWTVTAGMTVVRYDIGSSVDLNTSVGNAVNGGLNYFAGGPSSATSTASQNLSLLDLGTLLDQNRTSFTLSALLGGYGGQNDSCTLRVDFRSAANLTIGTSQIGPVLASDRSSQSTLLPRTLTGTVPAGTRSISLVLTATRDSGSYNDGYADNLLFRISAGPGDATLDGRVNFDDLLTVAQNYGSTGTSWIRGDFNGSGTTDFDDLLTLAQHYNAAGLQDGSRSELSLISGDWAMAMSLVPEPSIAMLAAPMLRLRRRR